MERMGPVLLGRFFKWTAVLVLVAALIGGCGQEKKATTTPEALKTGALAYEVIPVKSAEFDRLHRGSWGSWYDRNYRVEGVHALAYGTDRYLIVSAGEKPTGGYQVMVQNIRATKNKIEVHARLVIPSQEALVTQALTYPHQLIRLKNSAKDKRSIVLTWTEDVQEMSHVQTGTGRYVGRIDVNSVEIELPGLPKTNAFRAFRLNDRLREGLDSLGINTGDRVRFKYVYNQYGQPVLQDIERVP